MDHLEVIKLSRKIDGNGSIVLSSRYTPLIDVFLETSICDQKEDAYDGFEDFRDGMIMHINANVPENKQYLFDGNQVVIASAKWLSFRTLSINKKHNCYYLCIGMFGFSSRLIESFLKIVFQAYFGKPDVSLGVLGNNQVAEGPRLIWSHSFNRETHRKPFPTVSSNNSWDIINPNTLNQQLNYNAHNTLNVNGHNTHNAHNTLNTNNAYQSVHGNDTWSRQYLIAQLASQGVMAQVAHAIVQKFMANKKYSVMVFNASESEKELLPYYVQYILYNKYEKAGHIWLNIDFTQGNFNITDDVLAEVSINLPSIATYSNILEAYRDAASASNVSSNLQTTEPRANSEFGRYSSNKHTLNGVFDKMGDTEGAISIVYCDCRDANALTKLQDVLNTTDVQIQSFYRKGRIDGDLTFLDDNGVTTRSKKKERNILFVDKITGTEEKYGSF